MRVIPDHAPEQIEIAERNRSEDMMPGAARDEEIDHVAAHVPEQRGPADDVHLVQVTDAMHIRARIEQQAD